VSDIVHINDGVLVYNRCMRKSQYNRRSYPSTDPPGPLGFTSTPMTHICHQQTRRRRRQRAVPSGRGEGTGRSRLGVEGGAAGGPPGGGGTGRRRGLKSSNGFMGRFLSRLILHGADSQTIQYVILLMTRKDQLTHQRSRGGFWGQRCKMIR